VHKTNRPHNNIQTTIYNYIGSIILDSHTNRWINRVNFLSVLFYVHEQKPGTKDNTITYHNTISYTSSSPVFVQKRCMSERLLIGDNQLIYPLEIYFIDIPEENMSNDTTEVMYEYTNTGECVPRNVTHVRFRPSVSKIGKEGAFQECTELREVILNDGLREIGNSAFRECHSLKSITLPSSVTKIGDEAFRDCSSLKKVVLNEGILEIGDCAFDSCSSLQSITLPSTVTEIGSYAFDSCISLAEIVLNDGLKKIGDESFAHCCSLECIEIPSSVMEISQFAFDSCNHLREVVLSDGLKRIRQSAFQYCTALQSITIPFTVLEIDNNAFSKCTHLRDVVLNDGIKRIETNAFQDCPSLEHIAIPSTVIEIDQHAFNNCNRLREVVLVNEEVQIGQRSFWGCSSLERFKFPRLSTRLNSIIQAGQRDIEAKMDDISDLEWRGGELVIPATHRQVIDRWGVASQSLVKVDKEKLDKVEGLVRYYEMKEATTLLELALWKARIDQIDDDVEPTNRDAYRIEVPGPVKDVILQYLN